MPIPVISGLFGLVDTWLAGRIDRKKATSEREADHIRNEASWDELQARASSYSWKDEFWTLVLGIPVICAFVPFLVPYVKEGFIVLETMPDYYKQFVGGAIAASFGIRKLSDAWKAVKATK
jgi:hypothetical protein